GREEGLEVAVETGVGASFADALEHRHADIALGPNPSADRIAAAPFLRCRSIVVAAPAHPLAAARATLPSALAGERWLVGQPDLDPTTATGLFFERHGLAPAAVATYSSGAAAIAAAAAGDGIALVPAHSVVDEVRRRALVRLDVSGTPVVEMWHASTLGLGRALPAALAFQRFATTPEATQAISSGRAGAVSDRARPKVHVTLWSSVAARRS
ncbi:MAG TPA: LysR substrate-binding domain-containing protein, partial [Solirubrobacter sp.]|nr:LysR substrate-binding domain-containing protein [Solirubrobacter sp.]